MNYSPLSPQVWKKTGALLGLLLILAASLALANTPLSASGQPNYGSDLLQISPEPSKFYLPNIHSADMRTFTLLAAGDNVDCQSGGGKLVASFIQPLPGAVQLLGDGVWGNATYEDFINCFEPTYGQFKDRIRPAVGNHEYKTSGASGYSRYFGSAAGPVGKFYYSYDLGSWHIVVLNSNCSQVGGCQAGSEQEKWLRADLDVNKTKCTIAVTHHPRFSSGPHGNNSEMIPFWNDLYAAGVEMVLSGHDHVYERFAPMDPNGKLDPDKGIRQFVVGTGGIPLYNFTRVSANSEKQIAGVFGVLRLTLKDGSFDWNFMPAGGKTDTDSGSMNCH